MIYAIAAANLKNYIDLCGRAGDLTPEKSVFQVSVGKKDKAGWHYIVQDGVCQFKRGLYTGEIFIDWNDEYKYKEKSKKQIKQETTPDYEVSFKDEAEFDAFAAAARDYVCGKSSKRPKVRGSKLSGARCVTGVFDEILTECIGLQSADAADVSDAEKLGYAARMALFAIAEEINLMLKDGDPDVKAFAEGERRSFFFDTAGGGKGTWLTVHSGLGKVTPNQGTRLPALCGLEFPDDRSAVLFVYGSADQASAGEAFDNAYSFRGASTYGSGIDTDAVRSQFRLCCLKAVANLT
ncbi:MAG: hypothetical protein J5950_10755 [Clostridia bacterium]|nr:hypothetical protein [Clostridia bacterium]